MKKYKVRYFASLKCWTVVETVLSAEDKCDALRFVNAMGTGRVIDIKDIKEI